MYILIVSFSGNIGDKRSSPDYDDEDYGGDPFAPKKVVFTTGSVEHIRVSALLTHN